MSFAPVSCSVVIPTHNRPALLLRAVRSALLACPANGEVLVIDDQSQELAANSLKGLNDSRLRIQRTSAPSGAAAARNAGVAHSRGDVIFFLDDDDELLPDYCARVMARGAQAASFGFASTLEQHGEAQADHRPCSKHRLHTGPVPWQRPLRDHIAALSEGFWIRRHLFTQLSGFYAAQTVDEDTDLCARLYAAGMSPWYETAPGTRVYKGYAPAAAAAPQLTRSTSRNVQLQAYRRTFERNEAALPHYSEARWFLCTRFLRLAARATARDEATALLAVLRPRPFAAAARLYWWGKVALNLLRSRH